MPPVYACTDGCILSLLSLKGMGQDVQMVPMRTMFSVSTTQTCNLFSNQPSMRFIASALSGFTWVSIACVISHLWINNWITKLHISIGHILTYSDRFMKCSAVCNENLLTICVKLCPQ